MAEREEIIAQAQFVVDTKSTIRDAAKKFGIPKTTLHNHVTKELEKTNPELYKRVREVLDENKAERHIRGGMAIRLRYLMLKEN